MIFSINLYKNVSFFFLMKLCFSDAASMPITLLKNEFIYTESLSAVILEIYLLRNSSKQRHVKMQPFIC